MEIKADHSASGRSNMLTASSLSMIEIIYAKYMAWSLAAENTKGKPTAQPLNTDYKYSAAAGIMHCNLAGAGQAV